MARKGGINRVAIIQAAVEIADTSGVEAVTLSSVANKLGIRPPSLYNHVEGLPGLRKLLSIHGMDQLLKSLTQAAVGRSGDDAIHTMAVAYTTFARQYPGLYEITLLAPDPHSSEVAHAGQQIVDLVVQVLGAYGLEEDDALHMTRGLRSILHGFSSLEQKGGFGLPLHLETSLHLIIDTFLIGLHSRMKQ